MRLEVVGLAPYQAIAAHLQCVDQSKSLGPLRALHDVRTVEGARQDGQERTHSRSRAL